MGKLYCEHLDNRNYCDIDGHKVSDFQWENKCSYNYGNGCAVKENSNAGGCFITTITCNILGKEDNDPVMEGLRNFRNEILQKQDKYSDVLKMYDSIGPKICCNLFHDNNKTDKAEKLYSKLERFVELINESEYEKAAKSYVVMTLRLVSEYGIQKMYRNIRDNNFGYNEGEFNQATAGHGKKVAKTLDL